MNSTYDGRKLEGFHKSIYATKDRTPSLYVSSRFTSSNLKNIGSKCALNEILFTALIVLFAKIWFTVA